MFRYHGVKQVDPIAVDPKCSVTTEVNRSARVRPSLPSINYRRAGIDINTIGEGQRTRMSICELQMTTRSLVIVGDKRVICHQVMLGEEVFAGPLNIVSL